MRALDPVTLAVLKGRLEQIADEMDATLYRSAFNPIIAEARDACHGLYHAETGATLVQGTTGLPIFVGAMAFAVKAVIDKVRARGRARAGRHVPVQRPLRRRHASQRFPSGAAGVRAAASCSAGSPRSATGSISAATCPAVSTQARPKVFRRAFAFRRSS